MKPFIKDGKGNPSWTATILLLGFLQLLVVINCCVWAPDEHALHAQAILSTCVTIFFGIATLYFGRRGTEVYERVKKNGNGKDGGAMSFSEIADMVKGAIGGEAPPDKNSKPAEEADDGNGKEEESD